MKRTILTVPAALLFLLTLASFGTIAHYAFADDTAGHPPDQPVYLPALLGPIRAGGLPQPTPTATPKGTPSPGANLLINGDFANGFSGWSQVNNYWRIHDITGSSCAAANPDWPLFMAEMDRDVCDGCNTWPVGGTDWLRQDVAAPPHSSLTLTITEAHHMVSGIAEVNIYGSYDGATWQLIWRRDEPDALWGAGHDCETPPTFTYKIQSNYPFYRLELHGKLNVPNDGWIAGPLSLTVD